MSKHRTMTTSRFRWFTALLAAALVAAACSSAPDEAIPPTTAEPASTTMAAPATTSEVADEPADTTEAAERAVTTGAEEAPVTTAAADELEAGDEGEPTTEAGTDEPETGGEGEVTDDVDEADEPKTGDEGEPEEIAEEEPEAEELAEPNYENRSTGSVFPDSAYFDHDAIKTLFPECSGDHPAYGWIAEVIDYWRETYDGWDTASVRLSGRRIASGWWTDEQINRWEPGAGITAAEARRDAAYDREADYLWLSSRKLPQLAADEYAPVWWYPYGDTFPHLGARIGAVEQPLDGARDIALRVRDDGAVGSGDGGNAGRMLQEWILTRMQFPPTTAEPTAWAMVTLVEHNAAACVADAMPDVCASSNDDIAPQLRPLHRLGRALRNLLCS